MKRLTQHSGFSLVEMMVVIMIIGILAQLVRAEFNCIRLNARASELDRCKDIIIKDLYTRLGNNEPTGKHNNYLESGADPRDYGAQKKLWDYYWRKSPCNLDALKAKHQECVGDINGDGLVNNADAAALSNIHTTENAKPTPPSINELGKYLKAYKSWLDLNFDGKIDGNDIIWPGLNAKTLPANCRC